MPAVVSQILPLPLYEKKRVRSFIAV